MLPSEPAAAAVLPLTVVSLTAGAEEARGVNARANALRPASVPPAQAGSSGLLSTARASTCASCVTAAVVRVWGGGFAGLGALVPARVMGGWLRSGGAAAVVRGW